MRTEPTHRPSTAGWRPAKWRQGSANRHSHVCPVVLDRDPATGPGEACGPAEIVLEGFDPVYGEVLFLDMEPVDGLYEPLVGYIEQAQAAVDRLGRHLVHVETSDLK